MSDISFGYEKNHHVCSCGRHFGCGDISPETRAARASRMRDAMPELMPEVMVAFLNDFELYHGKVNYRMEVIGVMEGYYRKESKGKPLRGPVYVENTIPTKPYAD